MYPSRLIRDAFDVQLITLNSRRFLANPDTDRVARDRFWTVSVDDSALADGTDDVMNEQTDADGQRATHPNTYPVIGCIESELDGIPDDRDESVFDKESFDLSYTTLVLSATRRRTSG
ncbi:MAG: hypothetical protein ACJAZO_000260 [Myxococcota bacterium]|jgi:hypothetical protein